MTALDAAETYFSAWQAHDADAILASMTSDGTYADPLTGGPISGEGLRTYIEPLFAAFPDLNFEIVSHDEIGGGRVAARWIMRGTNTGSFRGLPPTSRAIENHGADFMETEGGKVKSVVGYFDAGVVPRQLGLQVLVQPVQAGPFKFGSSLCIHTGRTDKPGAFSITQLEASSDDHVEKVRELSRPSMVEMMDAEGFIGATTATIGRRMVTISAWTDPEAPQRYMAEGTHAKAMKTFYAGDLADSGYTSAWVPQRINSYWVRCDACGKMADHAAGTCGCGAALPEPPPYW